MGKDPAFLFYDADAAKDVSHMNRVERGGYFDIIQAQRKFGRMNIDIIKKVLGHDFETVWESIKIVMTYVDDMYFIFWVEESINKRKNYCESRSTNRNKGKINKIKKQHMSNICESYVEHMVNENENENTVSVTSEVPERKRICCFDENFEIFWKHYPKRVGKKAAEKAWLKIDKPVEVLKKIISALEWQTTSDQWKKEGGQFIPHPTTYLNQGRWMDDPPPSVIAEQIDDDFEKWKAEYNAEKEKEEKEKNENKT